MNDFNRRYDFDRNRRRKAFSTRLQTILILLAVLAVTGAVIYFIVAPTGATKEQPPKTEETVPAPSAPTTVAPVSGTGTPTGVGDSQQPPPSSVGTTAATNTGSHTDSTEVKTSPGTEPTKGADLSADPGVNDPLERAIDVTVRPGDTLGTIARRHHSTSRSIRHFNNLKSDRIVNGQTLKVIPGPWRITVDRKRNELVLEHAPDGEWRLFKSFPADATGLKGEFAIPSMYYHPIWIDAHGGQFGYGDPENPYGDYLLKLAPRKSPHNPLSGCGIHGVDDKTSNLKNCGRGCIHVGNRDIELLFYLVCPGTEVTVTSGETVRNLEK